MQAAVGACRMSLIWRFGNSNLINPSLFNIVLASGDEADSQTKAGNAHQTLAGRLGIGEERIKETGCRFTSPLAIFPSPLHSCFFGVFFQSLRLACMYTHIHT